MSKPFNIGLLSSLTLIALIVLSVLYSCTKPSKAEELTTIPLTEQQSLDVLKSPEAQKAILMQNQIIDNIKSAVSNGASMDTIKAAAIDAIENKKEDKFLILVFGSVVKGNAFLVELQNARKNFLTKYPLLLKVKDQITCTQCQGVSKLQVDKFFQNFNVYDKVRLPIISSDATYSLPKATNAMADPNAPTCGSYWQQTKLVVCATLCSLSTAGVGTALCGWACWCMLCPNDSALSSLIC